MQRPTNKSAPVILAVVLLLPVVYLLSTGPAFWLEVRGYAADEHVSTIYRPVLWIIDRSETCDAALDWYLSLWVAPQP